MHVGGFGRTVGRSGSWVSTYPPPTTSYRTSIQAPSPHKPAHRFLPSCLAPTFFCGGSLCQQRLCRFHPRVYGDTRSPLCVRFLGQTRPSKSQQTTVSPQSHFLTKVTLSIFPLFLCIKSFPNAVNIRGGYDTAKKDMVFTWTQYLHGVAYYCNLDFSLHAIVCKARPPVQYLQARREGVES